MSMYGRPSLGGGRPFAAGAKPGAANKDTYSFPILPPGEIIAFLRDMGVVVSEDDLNKPKADQFRAVCEQFVVALLGVTKEDATAPAGDHAHLLGATPDLHDESVAVVHFLRNM